MIKPYYNQDEQTIYNMDCLEFMKSMPDKSVDLVISSPPYNVGIEYNSHNDNKEWEEYEKWMMNISIGMFRVIRDGGRICWNIPSFSSRQNLYEIFLWIFNKVGFKQYAEIIWDKKQISSRTAWGSFQSASQPNILPSHEYILVFYKGNKNHGKGENDISRENFIKWTDGIWSFKPETNSSHPAPYPIELPSRCIQMFSYIEEIIFDPFLGSGTTLVACKQLKRKGIGIEISEDYCKIAAERLRGMPMPML